MICAKWRGDGVRCGRHPTGPDWTDWPWPYASKMVYGMRCGGLPGVDSNAKREEWREW